jgi:hypothetical protein
MDGLVPDAGDGRGPEHLDVRVPRLLYQLTVQSSASKTESVTMGKIGRDRVPVTEELNPSKTETLGVRKAKADFGRGFDGIGHQALAARLVD